MAEKIFNHVSYTNICPHCGGTLHQYSVLKAKKVLGIRISEEYIDFFECEGCQREYTPKFIETLLYNKPINRTQPDGTSIRYETTKVSADKSSVKTRVTYTDTIPTFKDEKAFVQLLGQLLFVFTRLAAQEHIDLSKVPHLKATYEKELEEVFINLEGHELEGLISDIYIDYAIFCKNNMKPVSWYVLTQSAKYLQVTNFVLNKEQEKIVQQLLKIYGYGELEVEAALLKLYPR